MPLRASWLLLVAFGLVLLSGPEGAAQIKMETVDGEPGHVGMGTDPQSVTQVITRNLGVGTYLGSTRSYGLVGEGKPDVAADLAVGLIGRGGSAFVQTRATGVQGEAGGNPANEGLHGYVFADPGQTGYGVYGKADGAGTTYAGYFDGDVYVSGSLTVDGAFILNGGPAPPSGSAAPSPGGGEGVLGRVLALATVRRTDAERGGTPGLLAYGFEEASFREAFPELVSAETHAVRADAEAFDPEDGGATVLQERTRVDPISLIPVLVQALQEQHDLIEEQRARIEALERLLGGE